MKFNVCNLRYCKRLMGTVYVTHTNSYKLINDTNTGFKTSISKIQQYYIIVWPFTGTNVWDKYKSKHLNVLKKMWSNLPLSVRTTFKVD